MSFIDDQEYIMDQSDNILDDPSLENGDEGDIQIEGKSEILSEIQQIEILDEADKEEIEEKEQSHRPKSKKNRGKMRRKKSSKNTKKVEEEIKEAEKEQPEENQSNSDIYLDVSFPEYLVKNIIITTASHPRRPDGQLLRAQSEKRRLPRSEIQ